MLLLRYKIKVIKGYSFNKVSNVFNSEASFVERLYNLKCNAKTSDKRYLYKLMLNSLLGRFALDINKSVTKLVDMKTYKKLEITTRFTSPPKRIQESMLVSYIPELDKKLCNSLDIDLVKARNILDNELIEGGKSTNSS